MLVLVALYAANFAGVRVAECAARAPVVVVIPVLLEGDLGFGQTGNAPADSTSRVSDAAVERLAT